MIVRRNVGRRGGRGAHVDSSSDSRVRSLSFSAPCACSGRPRRRPVLQPGVSMEARLSSGSERWIPSPAPTRGTAWLCHLTNMRTTHSSSVLAPGQCAPRRTGRRVAANGVSCYSESFCTAVGESSVGSGNQTNAVGVIEEWNGSAWSMAPNPQSSGDNVWLSSVSCPSVSRCVAVGQDDTDGGFVDTWDGTSWTMSFKQQGVSLSAVSCATPVTCVTVGAGSSNSLYSVVLASGTWSAESVPDPGGDGFLNDVSCASPTFCMAVGSVQVGGVGWATSLSEAWDGESWLVVPSPITPKMISVRAFWAGAYSSATPVSQRRRASRSDMEAVASMARVFRIRVLPWWKRGMGLPGRSRLRPRRSNRLVAGTPTYAGSRASLTQMTPSVLPSGWRPPTTRTSRHLSRQRLRRSDPSKPRRPRFNRTARVISPRPSPRAHRRPSERWTWRRDRWLRPGASLS